MWEYKKTINGSRFQATLKEREFELKFILTYWGLIGFDFGFINLSNVFIDRLRVPKYFFIAPIRKPTLPTNYFIEPNFIALLPFLLNGVAVKFLIEGKFLIISSIVFFKSFIISDGPAKSLFCRIS